MDTLVDQIDEADHVIGRHLVEDEEVGLLELVVMQVELGRAVRESYHMH